VLGLIVNVASVLLLSGGGHDHGHGLGHDAGGHAAHRDAHETAHHAAHRDNNIRAAIIHVLADAGVSLLVIVGLLLGRLFGWVWMDPVAGICGAVVIAAWSYGLIRDTGAILLDMNPDLNMGERMRAVLEVDGDRLTDLHLWRLGPGHLGAIVGVATTTPRGSDYYHRLLGRFSALSHVTVEVQRG
jgi:cation diffusion facilitator family transporter